MGGETAEGTGGENWWHVLAMWEDSGGETRVLHGTGSRNSDGCLAKKVTRTSKERASCGRCV